MQVKNSTKNRQLDLALNVPLNRHTAGQGRTESFTLIFYVSISFFAFL
jgi:hypothetical protein